MTISIAEWQKPLHHRNRKLPISRQLPTVIIGYGTLVLYLLATIFIWKASVSKRYELVSEELSVGRLFIERPTRDIKTIGKSTGIHREENSDLDGFGVCLLIKDDNFRLPEWLAYHWMVLPLKHLIVAIDPMSSSSPIPILRKWNNTGGLTIDVISDEEIRSRFPDVPFRPICMKDPEDQKYNVLKNHRNRQAYFLQMCMEDLKRRNHTWVTSIDTDEFMTFNTISSDDPDADHDGLFYDSEKYNTPLRPEHDPCYFMNVLGEVNDFNFSAHPDCHKVYDDDEASASADRKEEPEWTTTSKLFTGSKWRKQIMEARKRLPQSLSEDITIFDFIKKERDQAPWHNKSCMVIPRLFFSAVESTEHELSGASVRSFGFNAKDFGTLSYFRHARKGSWNFNKFGKPFMDLSRVTNEMIEYGVQDPHNPMRCNFKPEVKFLENVIRVHHYLGSWEQYSVRSDVRRDRSVFDKQANLNFGPSYNLQPWLRLFVKKIGIDRAKILLEGAGKIVPLQIIDLCAGGNLTNVPSPRVPPFEYK